MVDKTEHNIKHALIWSVGVLGVLLLPLPAVTLTSVQLQTADISTVNPETIPHLTAILPPPPIPYEQPAPQQVVVSPPLVVIPPSTTTTVPVTTTTTVPPTTTTTVPVRIIVTPPPTTTTTVPPTTTTTVPPTTTTTVPPFVPNPSISIASGSTLNVSVVPGVTDVSTIGITNTGNVSINKLSFGLLGTVGNLSTATMQLETCTPEWTTQTDASGQTCASTDIITSNTNTTQALLTAVDTVTIANWQPSQTIWIDVLTQLPSTAGNSTQGVTDNLTYVLGIS